MSKSALFVAVVLVSACAKSKPPASASAPAAQPPVAGGAAAASPENPAAVVTAIFSFQCGAEVVTANLASDGSAVVVVGNETLNLSVAPSESGGRYADAQGNELFTKGQSEAVLKRAGKPDLVCGAGGMTG